MILKKLTFWMKMRKHLFFPKRQTNTHYTFYLNVVNSQHELHKYDQRNEFAISDFTLTFVIIKIICRHRVVQHACSQLKSPYRHYDDSLITIWHVMNENLRLTTAGDRSLAFSVYELSTWTKSFAVLCGCPFDVPTCHNVTLLISFKLELKKSIFPDVRRVTN